MKKLIVTFLLSIPFVLLFSQSEDSVPEFFDTNHIVLSDSIAKDTMYANMLVEEIRKLIPKGDYLLAFSKADTAFAIYKKTIGYETKEAMFCQHAKGVIYTRWGEYKKAGLLYAEILIIQKKIHGEYHINVTLTLNNLAACYKRNGAYDKAIDCLNEVLVIRGKLFGESDHSLVGPLMIMGQCYVEMAEYDHAIKYLQKALDIMFSTKGENNELVADIYNVFGNCYYELNDFDKSIEYNKAALRIQLSISGEFYIGTAFSYNNIGNCYNRKGFYDKSIEYHQKALAIREQILRSGHPDIGVSYSNLGNVYKNIGEYDKAIEYHQHSLHLNLLAFGSDHHAIASSYYNIGNCYSYKGDIDNAINYFQKSLELRKKIYGKNHPLVAISHNSLGSCLLHKKLYDLAIDEFEICKSIFLNLSTPDSIQSTIALYNIGQCHFRKGDYNEALGYHKKVSHVYQSMNNKDPKFASLSYEAMGDTYFKLGLLDESKENYFKALKIRSKMLGDSHPSSIQILKLLIYTYQQMNLTDSAYVFTENALSAIKAQNISNIAAETKSIYQSQNLPIFENAIDLALIRSEENGDRNLLRNAYTYSEMAKATLLQSQVRQNEALAFSGIPDSLIDRENEIRLTINYREKQRRELIEVGKLETDSTVLRISSIIFDLKREQEELIAHFENEYPDYFRLRYDLSTISLEETQQTLLEPGQSLLEYFVGDSSVYVMVVTKDTFAIQGMKKDFPLDSMIQKLQYGIYGYYGKSLDEQTDDLYRNTVSLYTDAATYLYDKLVRPVSSLLTNDVIIVPDGVLGYVPFEILLKNKPENIGQFQNHPYLFKDHNVSYSYSATLLKEMKDKKHKKSPEKSILAMAPFYSGSYELLDSTINLVFNTLSDGRDTAIFEKVVTRKSFSSLPSSGEEVKIAAKIWSGDYYINQDGSRQNFMDKAGDYRILHLATHGTADEKDGKYSYLVFAETKDSVENEFLYVRDLYNTNLNADLVVLSACETALGELQRGEGIVSLARGFAYAGAKSVLTTLWVVDDTTTKDLLSDFYINLRKGQYKHVALNNAKFNHLKKAKSRYRHPFFWAGFIPIGDMTQMMD
jgi:CHAT domain-containing protein/Tfp pilus assembly protein PilF